ncbi:hypothetical protein mRhiFer1_007994 [Rhinolophus ferrumequinum]|uniref:Uncharacterized protein n=1 Tax=Rhinolophus ferrumequinum TaxID=59479 RepID=A0A7J7WQL8_RHIFE|nr:hypothetical protein mRhiFer1_007994 [Rhinolophus ferrumequinum]
MGPFKTQIPLGRRVRCSPPPPWVFTAFKAGALDMSPLLLSPLRWGMESPPSQSENSPAPVTGCLAWQVCGPSQLLPAFTTRSAAIPPRPAPPVLCGLAFCLQGLLASKVQLGRGKEIILSIEVEN